MPPVEALQAQAEILPRVSAFDAGVFWISFVGAGIFAAIRFCRGRTTETSDCLNDALNIGTFCILSMIAGQALGLVQPSKLAQANGFLICISLSYCCLIIGMSLWRSARGGELAPARSVRLEAQSGL